MYIKENTFQSGDKTYEWLYNHPEGRILRCWKTNGDPEDYDYVELDVEGLRKAIFG